MSPRWPGVAAAVVLSFAQHALAAGGFEITWRAPESCGTKADFESGVSRIVGKSFADLGSSWATAEVVISSTADAWRLRVRVVSVNGAHRERDVLTTTCREAVEAAELIVATSLSEAAPQSSDEAPSGGAGRARSGPPSAASTSESKQSVSATLPERPSSSAPAPIRAAPTSASAPTAARARRSTFSLGTRVGIEPILLPSATTFASIALALELERLRGELLLSASYPESEPVPKSNGGRARAELSSAALVGCYGGHLRAFALWGCLGAEAGVFSVTGEGAGNLINARTSYEFWGAGLAQGEALVPLSRAVALGLGVQGMATARRIRVTQRGAEAIGSTRVYLTNPADVRPWVGVEGRF